MFIPWWGIALMILLYAYLIVADLRMHRRILTLEECVRKLEGIPENHHPPKYEHFDVS